MSAVRERPAALEEQRGAILCLVGRHATVVQRHARLPAIGRDGVADRQCHAGLRLDHVDHRTERGHVRGMDAEVAAQVHRIARLRREGALGKEGGDALHHKGLRHHQLAALEGGAIGGLVLRGDRGALGASATGVLEGGRRKVACSRSRLENHVEGREGKVARCSVRTTQDAGGWHAHSRRHGDATDCRGQAHSAPSRCVRYLTFWIRSDRANTYRHLLSIYSNDYAPISRLRPAHLDLIDPSLPSSPLLTTPQPRRHPRPRRCCHRHPPPAHAPCASPDRSARPPTRSAAA